MNIAKRAIWKLANALGYEIVPTWRVGNYEHARYVRSLFEYFSIDCVIDVGANRGQYYDFLRNEVGYDGLVCSFEPIADLAPFLRNKTKNNRNFKLYSVALGRQEERKTFNITSNSVFSSFRRPDGKEVDYGRQTTIEQTVEVEVRTLDSMLPTIIDANGVKNIHLKMDTQGYDLDVLAGAERVLDRVSSLQSEMAVRKIYAGMPGFREAITYLEDRGFSMSQFFAVDSGRFPELIEFDCYAVNAAAVRRQADRTR